MKFSYFWLKKLVNFRESPQQLAELLTIYLAETKVVYQNKRPILDIDLPANRFANISGHLGISREISAILGRKFIYPKPTLKEEKDKIENFLKITNTSFDCRAYTSRVIFDVKVESSPQWLQEKLIDCGIRPINNIVDATNYIMLLTGQPLHAFDFDKIAINKQHKKEIVIRLAKEGETITVLDGKTFTLSSKVLLICDIRQPLAIAGIKGGIGAEITKDTKRIVLESANFDPTIIRMASRYLNLKTDASVRFEHDVPIDLASYALDLVAQLIYELTGGKILKGSITNFKNVLVPKNYIISDTECFNYLGYSIPLKEIRKKLELLGFIIQKQNNQKKTLLVKPPLYRNDILIKQDIIGEIGRLIGFNRIPPQPLKSELKIPTKNELWNFMDYLTDIFSSYKFTEVKNYSLISLHDKQLYQNPQAIINLLNPISDSFKSVRPNLMFALLRNVKENYRFYEEIKLFEIGNCYVWEKNQIKEKILLSGVWAHKNDARAENIFYQIKGVIESLFEVLNINESEYKLEPLNNSYGYNIIIQKKQRNEILGTILYIDQNIKNHFDLEGSIVIFELDILLLKLLTKPVVYHSLPLYPPVLRDLSCLIDKTILIGTLIKTIKESSSLLETVELFDVYQGKTIDTNKLSVSFHLIFRSPDKTLSNLEIDNEMSTIINNLKQLGVEIR